MSVRTELQAQTTKLRERPNQGPSVLTSPLLGGRQTPRPWHGKPGVTAFLQKPSSSPGSLPWRRGDKPSVPMLDLKARSHLITAMETSPRLWQLVTSLIPPLGMSSISPVQHGQNGTGRFPPQTPSACPLCPWEGPLPVEGLESSVTPTPHHAQPRVRPGTRHTRPTRDAVSSLVIRKCVSFQVG